MDGDLSALLESAYLATSTPFAVIRQSDGVFVAINDAFSRVIGHEREEILGKPANDFVVWADPAEFAEIMAVLRARGRVVNRLSTFVHASGERRVGRFSISAIEREGERYSVSTILDVTEEQAHRTSLDRRDAILEAVGYAAERFLQADWEHGMDEVLRRIGLAADASRAHIYQNVRCEDGREGAVDRFEWCAPDVSPRTDTSGAATQPWLVEQTDMVERLGSGEPVARLVRELADAERERFKGSRTLSLIDVPVFAVGDWWGGIGLEDCRHERDWSAAEVGSLRVAAGTLGAAIGRRAAERSLLEQEQIYRTLVEQLPAVAYVDSFGAPFRSIYTSPQISSMLGFTSEEWGDLVTWQGAIHPDDRDRVIAEDERTNRSMEPFNIEYRLITKDGHIMWIRDEARVVTDEFGHPRLWSGVMFDITSLKRAEEELARALDLEREASARLRTLDELKNTFLQAVSHDLRTPLSAVLGGALTLDRDDINLTQEESSDLVHRIAVNAKKLSRLVTDLLDLDRLANGLLEPQRSSVDVGQMVGSLIEESEILAHRGICIEADPGTNRLDPSKVERIVENLLVNAVRHTPPGTSIWVKVRQTGDGVLLVVDDNGPGIPRELRETIFRPFERGPTPSEHDPGTGIGLALVARFAELHGGRAWVEDRPGGGASFNVALPG